MAPHKKPRTLFDVALASHALLIYNSCLRIGRRNAPSDVEDLHSVLVSTVPTSMWNAAFERVLARVSERRADPTMETSTLETIYHLFASDKLTRVRLVGVTRNASISVIGGPVRVVDCPTSMGEGFWGLIFMKLGNVTEITFEPGAYTDSKKKWIFELIGKYCKNLETISVRSFNSFSFEAVSLLLGCKKLRRIEGAPSRHLSTSEFRRILESLPDLEYFDNQYLVSCFPELNPGIFLKLTELTIREVTLTNRDHFTLVAQLCPNLTCLSFQPQSRAECGTILDILANSAINLTSLSVTNHFPSGDRCRAFFTSKGIHLLTFQLLTCYSHISLEFIHAIGAYCVHLQTLKVMFMGIPRDADPVALPSMSSHRAMFKNLTTLKLIVKDDAWDWDDRIVPTLLSNATNLQTLYLVNVYQREMTLGVFRELFDVESVSELVDVTLRMSSLSREMVQYLYLCCPKLRKLVVQGASDDVDQYMTQMNEYVAENNIDMVFA